MADITCYYDPGDDITVHAAAALTGGRAVKVTATTNGGNPVVNVPTAAGRIFGVLMQDVASGAKGLVKRGNAVVDGEAGANIAAAAEVEVDATGAFITLATGVAVGVALEAIASAARGPIALY